MKKKPPVPPVVEPNVCLICRRPATRELLHFEKATGDNTYWASACDKLHMRQVRARVRNVPGWIWHVRRLKGAKSRALASRETKRRRG